MPRARLKDDMQGLGFITTLLVLVITFAVVMGVYMAFFAYKPPEAGSPVKIVEIRDTVTISYIGSFENGQVFDTSIKDVADDNASWPKALSFQWRQGYADFSFKVGKTDCTQGDTDCAIIGMSEAVLGLTEGSHTIATITPEKGYGSKSQSLITTRTIIEQIPLKETLNYTSFSKKYRTQPMDGLLITDPFYGWEALLHVSQGLVIVERIPELAKTYPLYVNKIRGGSWSITVQNIDDAVNNGTGAITVFNQFTFVGGDKFIVTDDAGDFFVTKNDEDSFTIDRNREVVGVNLVFTITILTIVKAS